MSLPDRPEQLVLPVGTGVVLRVPRAGLGGGSARAAGDVAQVVRAPLDSSHGYVLRFQDGGECTALRREFSLLRRYAAESAVDGGPADEDLFRFVVLRTVVGSRAYGLEDADSDVDRRGVYAPPADRGWSLAGVPEQIESDVGQECYWELRKFLLLALKANPTVLECLWSPVVEHADETGRDLLDHRDAFLSRLVRQTFAGYVLAQFRRLEQDLRTRGEIKWKHVMHLLRLLLTGTEAARTGVLRLRLDEHRERLLAVKRGEVPFAECDRWRLELHAAFDAAFERSALPERPDAARAEALLLRARRRSL